MSYMPSFFIVLFAFVMISTIIISVWVYKDAKQRGLNALLWAILVFIIGNFGGLILYLLVGRTQNNVVCSKCNSTTSGNGIFCSTCGEKIEAKVKDKTVRSYKGVLIALVGFIVVALLAVGVIVYYYFNASGFQFERRYAGYRMDTQGYMKNLSEKSSGDTWELSFDESSKGYTVTKFYIAKDELINLDAQAYNSNNGMAIIEVTQGDKIEKAVLQYKALIDLSEFEEGKLEVAVRNVDAEDFSATITIR